LSESKKVNRLEHSHTAKMVHGSNCNLSASYNSSPVMTVLAFKLHLQ